MSNFREQVNLFFNQITHSIDGNEYKLSLEAVHSFAKLIAKFGEDEFYQSLEISIRRYYPDDMAAVFQKLGGILYNRSHYNNFAKRI